MSSKIKKVVLILLSVTVYAFAGIVYEGNEYTETDMPFSQDGSGTQYFVFSGTISNVNSWNMRSLTINGVNYTNTWSSSMPAAVDGKKYFVIYNPKNRNGHFEINGTNDWSTGSVTIDTVAITLPYEHNGTDRVYLTTSGTINSVNSWSLDTLLINGVNYTNSWSATMPERVNGGYIIYYRAESSGGHVEFAGDNIVPDPTVDTVAISLPYEYNGADEIYFTTNGTINNVNSWSLDTLLINGVDYTNSWSDVMPERINGIYYIYYKSSLPYGHVEFVGNDTVPLEVADTLEINLPYMFDGVGHHVFMTTDDIDNIVSWETDSVSVNGMDVTNQSRSDLPEKINGKYYIYYKGSQGGSHVEITKYEPYPDAVVWNGNTYNKATLPFVTSGNQTQYVYVYGTITQFSSSSMTLLEINGTNYTNVSSTSAPASIDGKFFIKYDPKNKNSYFEIYGSSTEPVYILNIKVYLQSALVGRNN